MELHTLASRGKEKDVNSNPNYYKPYGDCVERQGINCTQKSYWLNIKNYFCDFCDNTSIHGWKFLGERERYFIERLWWSIVIFLAIYGSTILILKTHTKWNSAPVIVTFATTETPIWSIPFPAITICPSSKSNITQFNITDATLKEEPNETETKMLNLFATLCPGVWASPNATEFMDDREFFDFVMSYLHQASLDFCLWMGKDEECDKIFKKKLTPEGVCYTFNTLKMDNIYKYPVDLLNDFELNDTENAENWTLENGYEERAGLDVFPRRTFVASTKGGFNFAHCVEKQDLDYICTNLQGYKIILHSPAEDPDIDNHIWLPLNQAVMAAVKPQIIKTSTEIKAYSPEKRGCYLPGEKILASYIYYTQRNCMSECLSNYTQRHCGCLPFYDIYLYALDSIEICAGGKQDCVEEAKVQFLSEEIRPQINKNDSQIQQCNCLPSCTSIKFEAETSQSDWAWKKTIKTAGWNETIDFECSQLFVYYKDMQFMASERHELYGAIEFLANCGGLLGLFCGFSFISVMEILYYLTLRLICNFKIFGKRLWSGTKVE